ncbi:MAG TPA: peptidoglycan-binding domain-containing protein [Trebonia sp.]|jgi:hypothetical protein
MSATMYDSVTPARIPSSASIVAGYVDGEYAWTAADWGLFPKAKHVRISINGTGNLGDVLDVEKGNATPADTPGWIARRKAAGLARPSIYCSLSTVPAVRKATGALQLDTAYDIWVADWTGKSHELEAPLPGAAVWMVATQWESTRDYDVSTVYSSSWPLRLASTPPAYTWPADLELEFGSTGSAVLVMQQALDATGHFGVRNIAKDGDFGPQTLTSVRNFQAWKDLQVDGIAGPETRTALGA